MEILKSIVIIIAFILIVIFVLKGIYHTYHLSMNTKGKYSSYLGFFLFFMPNQFNDIGNKHRISLIYSIAILGTCWFVLFITGALTK